VSGKEVRTTHHSPLTTHHRDAMNPFPPHVPPTEDLADPVEPLAEDMVHRWRRGQRPRVEDYLERQPLLARAPEAVLELLSEEISLGREHGEAPNLADLVKRFPQWEWQVRALLDCHEALLPEPPSFPAAGERLGEFNLLEEIGRGAHARVFLASQGALADRLVVIKLAPRAGREHLSLARLQHSNIVPLYSVHDFPQRGLRGLCLPFFGGATLERLLARLDEHPAKRSGRNLISALQAEQSGAAASVSIGGPACRFLARSSWVQAVCWLGACLADALQYAGERGVVHLDLKPSNVLLPADGQPMLLDFHLARAPLAAGVAAPAWLGGTPGYMAPEQQLALSAVLQVKPLPAAVDGRADLYALGRLLCEMLAGRLPEEGENAIAFIRRETPSVPASVLDLVDRCLSARPEDRYASASDLADDLRRHLADLPLRGVRNRSLFERFRKWRRRRPHTLPMLLLALFALGVAAAVGMHIRKQTGRARAALVAAEAHLAGQRYEEALDTFRHGADLVSDLPFTGDLTRLFQQGRQRTQRARTAGELNRFCESVRPLYSAEVLPEQQARDVARHCRILWEKREQIHRCLADQSTRGLANQIRSDLLDVAILWAQLRVRLATAGEAEEAHREAFDVLRQAENLLGASCVLYQERRIHALALGRKENAREAERLAAQMLPRTAWEHEALSRALLRAGEVKSALIELERALDLRPRSLWGHFCKGCCEYRLGRFDDAASSFSICLVLAPESAWCAHNRGLAHQAAGRLDRALTDQDRALRLDPGFAAAALSRAMLHYRANRHQEALADLRRAQSNGLDTAELHGRFALVHLALRNEPAARSSAQTALKLDPNHRQAREVLDELSGKASPLPLPTR
jgi:serine/threonine protein kinase/Flp pilus assembly protein TadD